MCFDKKARPPKSNGKSGLNSEIMIPEALHFAQYRFMLRATTTIQLSFYKGSALRGAFGSVFKRMVCFQPVDHPRECDVCSLRRECPYGTTFENALAVGVEPLPGYAGIPHPFVLRPPLDRRRIYFEGDLLIFDLILVGRAIPMFPHFLSSFLELGKIGLGRRRGKFVVDSVFGVEPRTGKTTLIYAEGRSVQDWDGGVTFGEIQCAVDELRERLKENRICVEFVTPTRLISGGTLSNTVNFSVLLRSLLRRISGLCYFHCHERWDADFAGLVRQADEVASQPISLRWADWERYSSRQKKRLPMGGVIGKIEYYGDLDLFLPYLLLGTWLHVGKATTFGNGRYLLTNTKRQKRKTRSRR